MKDGPQKNLVSLCIFIPSTLFSSVHRSPAHMASDNLNTALVSKAVNSLLKWRISNLNTTNPKLFDEDEEFVYLVLTLKKVPQKGSINPNPHKIPLPHSLLSPSSEQCLIIDDRPKKVHLTKDETQKKIQSESIPISNVIKLSKLGSDYRSFEDKRKLCNSYDLFFADKRIVHLLPRLLGKQFFKKGKIPLQLDLKKMNWKEQVEKACSSTALIIRTGTCSVVKVGKLSMETDQIVENVVAAMNEIVEIVPRKWKNVRSFHVKLLDSLALPVYQAVPDVSLKIEGVGDVEKDEEGKIVKKKKKGRIHEIKYIDDKISEDGNDDGDDDDNGERGNGGLVSKRRKEKGNLVKAGVSSESRSAESLKESAKKKKDGLSIEQVLIKKSL